MIKPDYHAIYTDILQKKFPHKVEENLYLLQKKSLSVIDILILNDRIFGKSNNENQKYRSYQKSDILKMLEYQKKNGLNDTQLANHFKLSRNTVAKWKKIFLV